MDGLKSAPDIFRRSLRDICDRLGLALDEGALRKLSLHYELLVKWNRRIRLVGSVEPERAAGELFADSLMAGAFAEGFAGAGRGAEAAEMVDVGAGAGFPGFPIRVASPRWTLAAIEANGKKIAFLKTLCRELGLRDVELMRGRAETLAAHPAWRGRFDLAFCRAVAPPAAAVELAVPFLKLGGSFVLQAAQADEAGMKSIRRAAAASGATTGESRTYNLSKDLPSRLLLRVKKVHPTPP